MSAILFGATNMIGSSVTIQNGSGGGAPAVVDDGANVLANILANDRMVLWNTGAAPGSPLNVDVTFSGNKTINTVGAHGLLAVPGSAILSLKVYYQTGAYTPGGTWTQLGSTASFPGRDAGTTFADTLVRSLRYTFATSGQFSCGKFFAGEAFVVGGGAGAPGVASPPLRNAVMIEYPSGSIFGWNLGRTGRLFSVQFTNLSASDMALLDALAQQTLPFIVVDTLGRFFDCWIADKSGVGVVQSAPNPLYTVSLSLKTAP